MLQSSNPMRPHFRFMFGKLDRYYLMKKLESSGGTKPKGRPFVFTWVLTVALIGGLFYPVFMACTMNYLGQTPGLGGIKIVYEIKDAIAHSLWDEPVLYVLGGSSAYVGINAQLMERRLNHRVVNYGVHAGLGLEYQITRLLQILKPGDAVLLAFERNLYAEWEGWFSDLLHHYIFTYDPGYLWNIGPARAYKRVYGIPYGDLEVSLNNWRKIVKGELSFNPERHRGHLEISPRGDASAGMPRVRPLREIGPYRFNPYAKKVIKMFCDQAEKMNVMVYFAWPTNFKNKGFIGKEADLERDTFFKYFEEIGVTVLEEYSDHLYPLSFFSNTPFHLTSAGTRIRTEKLTRALRPYLSSEKVVRKSNDIFLLDENVHEITDFPLLQTLDFDYRVYTNGPEDPNTLNDKGLREALKQGEKIYFSDVSLITAALLNDFSFETVLCKKRALAKDVIRFKNHIFFLVFNEIDRMNGISKTDMVPHFREALSGIGYRCLVLGTGKYADARKEIRDVKKVELALQRRDKIGNYSLPFDLNMVSSPDYARIALDANAFFRGNPRPGLWMLVYDPDLGIVVDEFIYKGVASQTSDCLYRVGAPLKNGKQMKELKSTDLSLTGANAPRLEDKGGVITIRFTGKNSFVGFKLSDQISGKGSLVMAVLKKTGGIVSAGLQTNNPSKFGRLSPAYSLCDSENWQRVMIPFEVFSHGNIDPGVWGFVGLWGNDDSTTVKIRDIKLIAFDEAFSD